MSTKRGRERIFEIDPVKRPKGRFIRLLIAKYVRWVEAFGYVFCTVVATAIIICWIYKVDETSIEKEVGKSLLKPREQGLTHDKDAVVTRVIVPDWQPVAAGAPVVEMCDDPDWIRRFKVVQQLDQFAKALREMEKEKPLPPSIAKQVAEAEKEVDAWNKGEAQMGPRVTLAAAFAGEVVGANEITSKFFKADEAICTVADFDDIRISIKMAGTNVERVRVGMAAKIYVLPDYGRGCLLLGDAKTGWFESSRLEFPYVLDGEAIKALLLDWWKKHPVMADDDANQEIALTPTSVEEVEVTCSLQTEAVRGDAATKTADAPLAQVDQLCGRNPYTGTVVEGKHTGSYSTNHLDPSVKTELKDKVLEILKDKVVRVPGESDTPALRIKGINKTHNFIRIKAAVADLSMDKDQGKPTPPAEKAAAPAGERQTPAPVVDEKVKAKTDWALIRAEMDGQYALAAEKAIDVDKYKTDRYFEGVVRLTHPSDGLKQKVKEAYQRSPAAYLKVKIEVVVGRCRFAMLLFRQ